MQFTRRKHFSEVGRLAGVAIAGQLVTFAVSVVLARQLSSDQFEGYVVAAAVFLILLAVAAQGLDKYALRVIPAKFHRGHWQLAGDFVVFAISRILLGALLAGIAAAIWAWKIRDFPPYTVRAVYLSCLALPLGGMVHFLCALLSGAGYNARAAAITLLIVPAVSLLLIGLAIASPLALSAPLSIGCWIGGWLVGLALTAVWLRRAWPGARVNAPPPRVAPSWRLEALPFWLYRLSMGVIAQIAVLILDWLQPSATAVGAYAVALATASLVAVLAVATNRIYARELSILLERSDYTGTNRLYWQRLQWLLPVLGIFLLGAFLYTREILTLFSPKFVEEGFVAFRILALTGAITVLLGVAPTYLKYRNQNRVTFVAVGSGALIQVLLLLILVPRLEATGAAIAYMVSMVGIYGYLAAAALRQMSLLRAAGRYSG